MTGVPASAAGGSSSARNAKSVPGAVAVPGAMGTTGATGSSVAPAPSGPAVGSEASGSGVDFLVTDDLEGVKAVRGGKLGAAAVNQASLWNIANILTMIRLLLVPGFVALMLTDGGYDPAWRSLAWAAFAVAMITDIFDGHLARTYDLVTDFGKIADPIADKAIMGAALLCLSALGDLPWWVTGVILGRELGITLLRFVVIRYGVIPASRGGKLKTLTQGVAVGMYVLALTGPLATLRFWVMAAAVVLTVVTGLDYVRQAIVLRNEGIAAREAASMEAER
ncbi:CDP-diacylglycerol--glycerol-3-phosphate 3-phosphatidyltransferase [Streptomyces turgidiscabies]|uniref:CDP-diacylglycerol--glycerol-3-phosphate 3-phosphatidyltransferase n=1 Tax=Streptomyces turgidiscabies (strain Car8) TaxID=698760 RepID=L7F3M8_STRT8|nr:MULTISPECIES: CDP-diacylglycerol--glycerol-3-phosphate 3-phosphatidyltransferase [Streptomyces]ELP65225.1 CDP-diacylglycerol--glycerol-3-phosphate 3-phosphatidyltransferase [Streptomyces turgidiscabies Car8]MDX3498631.1 CDP-diacylglycerol--glycerol-3-phosphate 3-phosphatidyltransferase [Streptomyces turgidiscabies]GAQ73573.1 putative CDP-diacylglycerol--glycerol-3-phosphate 3-phosphatidyl-transferase 2 [Streptomyces turgidiscabies]